MGAEQYLDVNSTCAPTHKKCVFPETVGNRQVKMVVSVRFSAAGSLCLSTGALCRIVLASTTYVLLSLMYKRANNGRKPLWQAHSVSP